MQINGELGQFVETLEVRLEAFLESGDDGEVHPHLSMAQFELYDAGRLLLNGAGNNAGQLAAFIGNYLWRSAQRLYGTSFYQPAYMRTKDFFEEFKLPFPPEKSQGNS
ncbi:hypothetical protein HYU14_06430 [Candidatus Woesearchaeota archaeon]|nr:hypothetical protein [Candidatus Woesearchaeota archaeon]